MQRRSISAQALGTNLWHRGAYALAVAAALSGCAMQPGEAIGETDETSDQATSTNLALNRPVRASSVEKTGLEASRAVDGNSSSRWASAFSDPQWIYVDLGTTYTVNRVRLNWEAAYARSYQIQVSSDASTWRSIYSTTSGNGGVDDVTGLSANARYVRIYGTVRATQYGYSLWDFEVYGSTVTSTDAGSTTDASTGTDSGTVTNIACPAGQTEVFRDDFNGTALDTNKWRVANQNVGGGTFTQQTVMLPNNVSVANGRLSIASRRHCSDPWANPTVAAHPTQCGTKNYYSGGWISGRTGYSAGKGLMVFLANMPAPVQGYFPGLWARNTQSTTYYGELDLYENWWDLASKGTQSDPNMWASTTWLTDAPFHSTNNIVGPQTNVVSNFHVWEVEWDATVTPATIKYYYRSAPGATRVLMRTVTSQSSGFSGNMTEAQFKAILNDSGCTASTCGFRPYIDFAVQPDTTWHIGPDAASTYAPAPVQVDSVIVCRP